MILWLIYIKEKPATLYHEELSKNEKVMKMNFDLGEVVLSGIDLRVSCMFHFSKIYTLNHIPIQVTLNQLIIFTTMIIDGLILWISRGIFDIN